MALAEYLQYMQQVLGVREVLLGPEMALETLNEAPVHHRKVLFIDTKKWTPAALELFNKMRQAMKLNSDEIQILFANETALADIQLQCLQAQEIVSFDANIFSDLQKDFPQQLTQTIGPEVLLKDPAKKKETWAELQKVMQKLTKLS